ISRPSVRAAVWTSTISSATLLLQMLARTATRRSPGTTSRMSSSRLPASSGCWIDRPVTLPPGRANEATRPAPTGSPATAKTIGIVAVARCAAGAATPLSKNDTDVEANELSRDFGVAFAAPFRPAILDHEGRALDPAELTHALHKGGDPRALG